MKASQILRDEHRVIERVLDVLERLVEQVQAGAPLDRHSAGQAIEFFRGFADRCHHAKEEDHFFPAMEAKGFPRQGGPTGVMLFEHQQGRECIAGMHAALTSDDPGDEAATERFVQHARAYIELLRDHILKEDTCLFAMADQAFTAQDQQQLLEAFARTEKEHTEPGLHEKFLRLADELAARFGLPDSGTMPSGRQAGSCGHTKH